LLEAFGGEVGIDFGGLAEIREGPGLLATLVILERSAKQPKNPIHREALPYGVFFYPQSLSEASF
jgi:hypothetical protein